MLAAATLLVLLDSIAKGVEIAESALGVLGTEPGTVAGAAASNRDVLAALDDATVQEDLTPVFARRAVLVRSAALLSLLQGAMLNRALDAHYGGQDAGDLNRYLAAQNVRVHANLNRVGFQIDAKNVFPPTVLDPVARYEGSGAGTGDFIAGSDIDTTKYGEAGLEVVVEVMGNAQRDIRATLKKFDGTTETRDVVVPANTAANTVIPIGGGADRYIGVAGITTTNGSGTAADRLRVRSKVERVIAL